MPKYVVLIYVQIPATTNIQRSLCLMLYSMYSKTITFQLLDELLKKTYFDVNVCKWAKLVKEGYLRLFWIYST
jgi:hypothetical protein